MRIFPKLPVSKGTVTILFTLATVFLLAPATARALEGWDHGYRLEVVNPGPALADYQVKVVLDHANFDFGVAQPDGADLRITETDLTTLLPHWIETWDADAETAVVWVRLSGLAATATRDLVLWSGNPAAISASDGAATFLFYSGFEEPEGQAGMNAPAPQVTPTYDGSGQVVHPDVVHVPGGWNGYEYWMGMTPYPNGNQVYENPSVLATNDNATWVVPAGLTNPLAPTPVGHNDDVDMLLVDGEMVLYYVETNDDDYSYLTRFASTDGVDWGAPQVVLTIPNYVMSPAVTHDGTTWTMWYFQSPGGCTSSYQDIWRCTSSDGIVWGPAEPVTLVQPGRIPWHFDIQYDGSGYDMLFISYPDGSSCNDTRLYHAASADGLVWSVTPETVLGPSYGNWDDGNIYRASFTRDGDWLRIWYSSHSSGGQWRVGFTEGDLDDFLTPDPTTWNELRGNVAFTTEFPRTGTHGLREDGGSTYPQAFGALTGGDVCVNVWYLDDQSAATDLMAILRIWDTASVYHCVGAGVWTGSSTTAYSYHTEDFAYTATGVPRIAGWRHLSVAALGSACEFRIDGTSVGTVDVLDPALINRFSVEGYRGGTGFFDDAYVRRFADPEPVATVVAEIPSGVPSLRGTGGASLEQNVPNPLNPGTTIAFELARPDHVTLRVVDLHGRVIRTLVAGERSDGRHEVAWDGRDERGNRAASGTYLYRLVTSGGVTSRKLVLVK